MSGQKTFELNVYPKISKNLGIATHTERFETRKAAEEREREIRAADTEGRLHIEIAEVEEGRVVSPTC